MAKVALNIEKGKPTGIVPTQKGELSTEDEYQFVNDGKTTLRVANGGAEDTVVTIVTPGVVGGLDIDDQEVTVAKEGGEKVIGPFDTSVYNDADNKVTVKFSKVASVTVETVQA